MTRDGGGCSIQHRSGLAEAIPMSGNDGRAHGTGAGAYAGGRTAGEPGSDDWLRDARWTPLLYAEDARARNEPARRRTGDSRR